MKTARRSFFIFVASASLTTLPAGCWPGGARFPEYSNVFNNVSDVDMDDVWITWTANGEGFHGGAGFLRRHAEATDAFCPDPIPEKVLAHWRTADGKVHEKTVEVAPRIQNISKFGGDIYFKFFENDVVVVPVSDEVLDRNRRLGKETVP